MAAARDRCGITPAQGLSALEALRLFTTGSAAAIGEDAALRPGAKASLTVLDGDPVASPPEVLRSIGILETWVRGEPVAVPSGIVTWQR